jgi:Transcriptional Coactivator p15 (PC4)
MDGVTCNFSFSRVQRNPVKKSKSSSSSNDGAGSSARVDGAKEPTWAIEKMRYVKIREFKGKLYVDIREFYEKDGDELPGKKGLNNLQLKSLLSKRGLS